MSNSDLLPNTSSHSVDSSPSHDSGTSEFDEVMETSADDSLLSSMLEQQVEAAVRDVEDLLDKPDVESRREVVNPVIEPISEPFDWSAPDLVVADEQDIDRDATYDALADINEAELGQSIGLLQSQMSNLSNARIEAENFVLNSVVTEARLRTEAAERRREEESERLLLEETVARRRQEDEEQLRAHVFQVQQAESQAQYVRDEQARLRAELKRLNDTAEALLQRRMEREDEDRTARLSAAAASRDDAEQMHLNAMGRLRSDEESLRSATVVLTLRRNDLDAERQRHEVQLRQLEEEREQFMATVSFRNAENVRLRNEALERVRVEQDQLLAEEVDQRRITHELEQKRAELERARAAAEADSRRVAEAWIMMRNAEESSRQTERERLSLEAEIFQRADEEKQSVEGARRRAEEQRRLFEEGEIQRFREEERRVEELEKLRVEAEEAAQARIAREMSLRDELSRLKLAEEAALQRIEESDLQRRMEHEKHNQTIERLQRLEAEAKMRSADENGRIAELEKRLGLELDRLNTLEQQYNARAAELRSGVGGGLDPILQDDQESPLNAPSEELHAFVSADEPGEVVDDWVVPAQDEIAQTAIPVFQDADLRSDDPARRAASLGALARLGSNDAYERILSAFDDPAPEVRNAAARALYELDADKPVESFTRALKESSEDRREKIGRAIYGSGLANEAISQLCSANREETYNALCLLFTMAKTGKVDALVHVIETHEEVEIRLAAVRLLTLSGHADLANAAVKRRLRVNQG